MRPSDSRSLAAALLAKLDEEEDRGDTRSRVHTSYPQVSMFDHDIDAIEIRGAVDPSAIYIPSSVNAFNHPAQQKVEYEEDSSFIPYSSPTPIREPVRPASFSLHRQGAKHLVPPKHTQNTAHRHPLLPAKDDVPFVRKASPTLNTSPMNIPKVSSDPYGDSIWEDSEYVEMNTTVADNVEETIQDDEPVVTPEELKRREEEKSTAISNNKLGVKIIPVTQLPDKWRSIFRFGSFNPVQSKVFHATYETDENLVVSAPTGSGKTTIFELAFIRMMKQEGSSYGSEPLAIYLAPTKALCNERARDWDERLSALGIRCIEVTGDTGHTAAAINALKEANLIVTTPEKWDSLTRRASAIAKVMNRLALIMIDEVHILREPRGATLEVVISRMKSRGDRVRFVALSASVPNIEDVARWLAPSHTSPDTGSFEGQPPPDPQIFSQQPIVKTAKVFKFGEEFRPTQLERQVYGFDLANEWATHAELDKHLYKILLDHSKGQPVLVFCSTRKSCQTTAETIFKAYKESRQRGSKLPWRLQDQ
ncbi:P-loop containing nucleoside triphosphate hydrolase protein [Naematelia encephala]|uniref:p-loop containing nucleoside triphosphate hydrolase protein n=1 Tax=Naematelia encephala TaxID=71784 RepID=A0A1Y2AUB3_9TREE|nr:P-loop containing nucleoside triphosphate hydrolase protein [Naematelia encephala]